MTGLYVDREQTRAKHFILEHYLQELAFKVLQGGLNELAYIDGFSGPWKSRAADHSDTSFMIAIRVLEDVQKRIMELRGQRKVVRCFFVEEDATAYAKLAAAVAPHHDPDNGFIIETRQGRFQDFIPDTLRFIGRAFPLIFIDPTGWTGYPFEVIRPLLKRRPSEVLINFMFDHINRFAASDDPPTVASLGEILGGANWRDNLDPNLPRGIAVEQLFRDVLRREGGYDAVLSTCIDKSLQDRPHFSCSDRALYSPRTASRPSAAAWPTYSAGRPCQTRNLWTRPLPSYAVSRRTGSWNCCATTAATNSSRLPSPLCRPSCCGRPT